MTAHEFTPNAIGYFPFVLLAFAALSLVVATIALIWGRVEAVPVETPPCACLFCEGTGLALFTPNDRTSSDGCGETVEAPCVCPLGERLVEQRPPADYGGTAWAD